MAHKHRMSLCGFDIGLLISFCLLQYIKGQTELLFVFHHVVISLFIPPNQNKASKYCLDISVQYLLTLASAITFFPWTNNHLGQFGQSVLECRWFNVFIFLCIFFWEVLYIYSCQCSKYALFTYCNAFDDGYLFN